MNVEERVVGKVHSYIKSKLGSGEVLHFSLIDPDKVASTDELLKIAENLVNSGTDAFLVGGSLGVSESYVDHIVKTLKTLKVPVILFPGNVSGISRFADAILFMSLLNSDDPYFIIGAQVSAAPIIAKYGLEVLPTAYIIVGYGGAAGFIGRARPIPYEKPEIGAAYVLAAKYLGMQYVYLEAGSGAPKPIPTTFIQQAAKVKGDLTLIIGGGIRSADEAKRIVRAGADIVVTGTVIEQNIGRALKIIETIKRK